MNFAAVDALRGADLIVCMTDVWDKPPAKLGSSAWLAPPDPIQSPWIRPGDREVIEALQSTRVPVVLSINKVDRSKDKTQLLPMLEAYSKVFDFAAIVPTSLRKDVGVTELLSEVAERLPEGPQGYEADVLTNRPVLFFVREYVREAVMNQLRSEVPHAVAVTIEQADETDKLLRLSVTIHVEKVGQRKIVVGKGGAQIKSIGVAARERIEALVEKQVHLELFVRITDEWKNMPRMLAEMGYDDASDVSMKGSNER